MGFAVVGLGDVVGGNRQHSLGDGELTARGGECVVGGRKRRNIWHNGGRTDSDSRWSRSGIVDGTGNNRFVFTVDKTGEFAGKPACGFSIVRLGERVGGNGDLNLVDNKRAVDRGEVVIVS